MDQRISLARRPATYSPMHTTPLSEFELDEVTNESLVAVIRSPAVPGLDVGQDTRTWDRIGGARIAVGPGCIAAVNGGDAGHRSPSRRGVLGDPAVMLFRRIHGVLRTGAQHGLEPVLVGVAESPGHLRTKVKRLATALHLPDVDPDRHAMSQSLAASRQRVESFPHLPPSVRGVKADGRGGGRAPEPTVLSMTSKISHGVSGAIRRFAGWVAGGSVGHPMLEGINYWDELRDSPSQMEICFAIFVNVLELDDSGQPINEKYAEKRAATWIYQYCTGKLPPGQPELEPWEVELY